MDISVCMCTYNGEKYINQQLNSIVTQTEKPDEIIIFDDCSNDKTIEIINQYVNKYKEISWKVNYNKVNKGWKVNFYEAINKTSGNYIFLCDQDDIWEKDKIERMTKILKNQNNIELLVCNPVILYENTGKKIYKFKKNSKVEIIKKNSCLTYTAFPGCTYAFKRKLIDEFNDVWRPDFPHDAILWKIAYLKETLYVYNYYGIIWRRHDSNATNKMKNVFSSENVKLHYDVLKLYKSYYDALIKINKITIKNQKKMKKFLKMLELRQRLYENKSIISFLKLIMYIDYYASKKAFLFEYVALTNKNIVAHKKGKKNVD